MKQNFAYRTFTPNDDAMSQLPMLQHLFSWAALVQVAI
jgi:hypothetical protein